MKPFRIPRAVILGLVLTVVADACGASSHASTSATTAAANPGGSANRGGGAAGGGGFPDASSVPSGGSRPSAPTGSFPGGGNGFGFATGKVTSINTTQMVIDGISSSTLGGARDGGQASTPPSSVKTSPVTIGLSSSTTYTAMESTASGSLAVGDCVSAIGSTDSTGAVTAQSVRITSTGGQSCTGGFPGGGGAGGAANGGAGSANGGSNG
jgi:hypothetical protein